VVKVSVTVVKDEYRDLSGRIMTLAIGISMLDCYIIDGDRNDLLPDFNAAKMGYKDTLYFITGEVGYA
jgi:hypothetical protein